MKVGRFISNYVRSSDIKESGPRVLTFSSVEPEEIGSEERKHEKLVGYFEELEQGIVLGSKTVLSFLEDELGEDTDDWIGKQVVVYYDPNITFGGKRVGGLRFRLPEKD